MSVFMDDSAETILPAYGEAFDPVGFQRLRSGSQGRRRGKRSVGSMQVVVPLVLVRRVSEVGLVPDRGAVQQFGARCLHPALHDRVHTGHPDAGQDCGDPGAAEDLVDQCGVFGVAVAGEECDLCEVSGVLEVHEQVADGLRHPGMVGVRGGAEDVDAPACVVDGSQGVLALRVMVSMKSIARIASACERRKVAT